MPKWVTELPGKWVGDGSNGGPQGLVEIVHPDERSAKCFARWHGAKGGPAGFEGRFASPREIRGQWFDMDAQLYDRDRLGITVEIENNEITVKASTKDGGTIQWSARRPYIHRDGGKLTIPSGGANDVFLRLAQPTSPRRPEWLEEKRKQMLEATLRATGGVSTKDLKSSDGAITYIPPMAVTEPFDDGASRRLYENSPRFRGRQMYGSINIAGQPMTVPPSPSFPYLPRPYMAMSDVARVLRLQKEKQEATLPEGLKGRKKFRPSSACGPRRPDNDLFLSAIDALKASNAEIEKLKKQAAEQGGFAELPRRPASAGTRGAPESKVVKGPDGKLTIQFAKRGMIAAAKKEVRPIPIPEYIGEDFDGPRLTQREEAAKEKAKVGDRRPFTPSGPRLVFSSDLEPAPGADTPKEKPVAPSSPRSPRPQSAGANDSNGRKLFSPYLPTQAADRPSQGDMSARKWKDYPEYIPTPYVVFPDGGMQLLRAPTPPIPTLESIKGPAGGGGNTSRPTSPRGPRKDDGAAAPSSPRTSGSPRPQSAGANTAAGLGDRALWKPGATPSNSSFRPVVSVVSLGTNIRRLSKSGVTAMMMPLTSHAAEGASMPPHSPLRISAPSASAASGHGFSVTVTAPRSGTGMDQLSPLPAKSRPSSAAPGGRDHATASGQSTYANYDTYNHSHSHGPSASSSSSAAASLSPSRRPSVTVGGGGHGGANPQESFSRAQSPMSPPLATRGERASITNALGLTMGGGFSGAQSPLRMPSLSVGGSNAAMAHSGPGVGMASPSSPALALPTMTMPKQRPSSAMPVLRRAPSGAGNEGFSVSFSVDA